MDIWILFLSFFIAGAVDSLIAASLAQLYRETVGTFDALFPFIFVSCIEICAAINCSPVSEIFMSHIPWKNSECLKHKIWTILKSLLHIWLKDKKDSSQNCVLNMNCIPWLLISGKSFPLWNRIRDRFNEFSFVVVKIDTWKMSTDRDQ